MGGEICKKAKIQEAGGLNGVNLELVPDRMRNQRTRGPVMDKWW